MYNPTGYEKWDSLVLLNCCGKWSIEVGLLVYNLEWRLGMIDRVDRMGCIGSMAHGQWEGDLFLELLLKTRKGVWDIGPN